ncbi:hypothetical protein B0H16DRAFT_1486662 [Mycena metata]|uniref:Uncharacterized protein n=1 Tax=Mycena metata TaxID=1033252 RepID=A0AAD7DHS2_9AGAR|nr:hypothetical protein B0H16DRAFT_1486662 [Mycena metata]
MSFFKKIEGLVEKLPEGYQHTRDEIIGLINPNRRHDDPEEKRLDEIRAEINAGHRFDNFAAERSENFVKWHIDGHDYMWALSEMIDNAREVIFIQTLMCSAFPPPALRVDGLVVPAVSFGFDIPMRTLTLLPDLALTSPSTSALTLTLARPWARAGTGGSPELYLRRPPAYHPEWRLDRLLKRKAEEGVKGFLVIGWGFVCGLGGLHA